MGHMLEHRSGSSFPRFIYYLVPRNTSFVCLRTHRRTDVLIDSLSRRSFAISHDRRPLLQHPPLLLQVDRLANERRCHFLGVAHPEHEPLRAFCSHCRCPNLSSVVSHTVRIQDSHFASFHVLCTYESGHTITMTSSRSLSLSPTHVSALASIPCSCGLQHLVG